MSRPAIIDRSTLPLAILPAPCSVCGKNHTVHARHYEVFRTECGLFYWALQPRRGSRLLLFLWPGPPMTARELAEKEAHKDGTPYIGDQNI